MPKPFIMCPECGSTDITMIERGYVRCWSLAWQAPDFSCEWPLAEARAACDDAMLQADDHGYGDSGNDTYLFECPKRHHWPVPDELFAHIRWG